MDIDWTIVVAQIINFVGLVWLLNRFLYEPIVKVISARETKLKERFEQAESLQAEAKSEIARYEAKRTDLERTREQYLQQAREEARETLSAMLEEANAEAHAARRRMSEQLAVERRELEQTLQEGIITQVSSASERLLQTMAGRSIADGIIDAFGEQLRQGEAALDAAPVAASATAAEERSGAAPGIAPDEGEPFSFRTITPPIMLRMSFLPDAQQRTRLREMLQDAVGRPFGENDIEFVHDQSLVLGVELQYDGSVVSWHARHVIGAWEAQALRRIARSEKETSAVDDV